MKNILVVGATSAIAGDVMKRYAAEQANFYLVGRNADRLSVVASDLSARGAGDVHSFPADVSERERLSAIISSATQALGTIDVALIAHGILPDQEEYASDAAKVIESFEVNAISVIYLMTVIANVMETQGSGVLAVISSVAGDRGRKSNYVYGSAKAAVNAYLEGLRGRLADTGVTVLTIKPGMVDTPMTSHLEKSALFATPEKVGGSIYQAINKETEVLYTPWFWKPIMTVIKHIPGRIFKKMSI